MKLFDEVEKVSNLIIEDLDKTKKFEDVPYIGRSIEMIIKKTIQYEVLAKELELQLLTTYPMEKAFKKTYKKLDGILKSSIKDLKREVPKILPIEFKTNINNGVIENHEEYIKVFKRFENEVTK